MQFLALKKRSDLEKMLKNEETRGGKSKREERKKKEERRKREKEGESNKRDGSCVVLYHLKYMGTSYLKGRRGSLQKPAILGSFTVEW